MKPLIKASAILILFSLTVALAFAEEVPTQAYSDVPTNYVYTPAIAYMTENKHVEGYEDGIFDPEKEINRVEALKMILSATDTDLDTSSDDMAITFPDIDENQWYMPYVKTAVAKGIITGNDDGTLKPENTVNRVEALKMLVIASNATDELRDLNLYWYSKYLQFGIDKLLIIPDQTGSYLPEANLTRGELCDLLYRFYNQPITEQTKYQTEYGKATYYGYSFDGSNTASGTPLEAYGYMAAHKTLPFGTVVRVINLDNNLYVDVTIVDRGPYVEGRVIDLTPAAFDSIGSLSAGILNVRLEVLIEAS